MSKFMNFLQEANSDYDKNTAKRAGKVIGKELGSNSELSKSLDDIYDSFSLSEFKSALKSAKTLANSGPIAIFPSVYNDFMNAVKNKGNKSQKPEDAKDEK